MGLEWARVRFGAEKLPTDFVVSIEHRYSGLVVLDGSSLGPALAVMFFASMENRQIVPGIVVTGRLDDLGKIGQVGDLPLKAQAARAMGASILLIPGGQHVPEPRLSVIEVTNMSEVIEYMLR
jgi:predicted S18 family serine protease